jgi:hypothetical protein
MEVSGELHTLAASTHWIGGWVGPRASKDALVKRKNPTLSLSGIEHPQLSVPQPSLYTN